MHQSLLNENNVFHELDFNLLRKDDIYETYVFDSSDVCIYIEFNILEKTYKVYQTYYGSSDLFDIDPALHLLITMFMIQRGFFSNIDANLLNSFKHNYNLEFLKKEEKNELK